MPGIAETEADWFRAVSDGDYATIAASVGAFSRRRDANGETALIRACRLGSLALARFLATYEAGLASTQGYTALMVSALSDAPDLCALLVSVERDVRLPDGRDAYMLSAQVGAANALQALTPYFDLRRDRAELNALDYAVNGGHLDCVNVILGSKPITGGDLRYAIDLARESKATRIVSILESFKAKHKSKSSGPKRSGSRGAMREVSTIEKEHSRSTYQDIVDPEPSVPRGSTRSSRFKESLHSDDFALVAYPPSDPSQSQSHPDLGQEQVDPKLSNSRKSKGGRGRRAKTPLGMCGGSRAAGSAPQQNTFSVHSRKYIGDETRSLVEDEFGPDQGSNGFGGTSWITDRAAAGLPPFFDGAATAKSVRIAAEPDPSPSSSQSQTHDLHALLTQRDLTIDDLREQLAAAHANDELVETLKRTVHDQAEKIEELTGLIQTTTVPTNGIEEELTKQLHDQRRTIESLHSDVARLQDELRLTAEVTAPPDAKELAALRQEVSERNEEIERLRGIINSAPTLAPDLLTDIGCTPDAFLSLQLELEEKNRELEELRHRATQSSLGPTSGSELPAQGPTRRSGSSLRCGRGTRSNQGTPTIRERDRGRDELSEVQMHLAATQEELAARDVRIRALEAEAHEHQASNASLQDALDRLEDEKYLLEQKLRVKDEETANAWKERDALVRDLRRQHASEEDAQLLKAEVARLLAQANEAEDAYEDLVKRTSAETHNLQTKHRSEIDVLQREIAERVSEAEKQAALLKAHEDEITELKQKLAQIIRPEIDQCTATDPICLISIATQVELEVEEKDEKEYYEVLLVQKDEEIARLQAALSAKPTISTESKEGQVSVVSTPTREFLTETLTCQLRQAEAELKAMRRTINSTPLPRDGVAVLPDQGSSYTHSPGAEPSEGQGSSLARPADLSASIFAPADPREGLGLSSRSADPRDLEGSGDLGMSELMVAVVNGESRAVGANLAQAGRTLPDGTTALMLAAEHNRTAVVKYLAPTEAGMRRADGARSIDIALQRCHIKLARALIPWEGFPVDKVSREDNRTTELMRAVMDNDPYRALCLAERQLGLQTPEGKTALMFACERGSRILIQLLLGERDARDREGRGPVDYLPADARTPELVALLE
ncbi:Ankyrin repeat protein 1 [Giardia muris]|uniref:Ankyrin repeat protein 1 n=1 Tax=Giardia muris TaxID=5742 RepID=A0A4Z1T590_GIAMU|nr:Ankyrin repeat protein 1 [Giardia muris]|eukprot:TNJ27621.1 Ankyrin repeat protein 1 [Giardia muris]